MAIILQRRRTRYARYLLLLLLSLIAFGAWRAVPAHKAVAHRMIVLGIDGMDPQLLERYVREGIMPNFVRLAREGSFRRLKTTMPPQSPVAWSTLITGTNPGSHGIFDFIQRNTTTLAPYLSTSKIEAPKHKLSFGKWIIPLSSGKVILLREGEAFWQVLDKHGIPATVFRIPSNFPPVATRARTLSGMGTPDIQGTYGTFSFFTDDPFMEAGPVNGGRIYRVSQKSSRITAKLEGPPNSFRRGEPPSTIDLNVWVDSREPVVRIDIQDRQIILREGEWSEWVPVSFDLLPHVETVSGLCRFYLKQVQPSFKLYVSPINLNPARPALPLSTPDGYSAELSKRVGYYYTQGIAEDTKAPFSGVLSEAEFRQQAQIVFDEAKKLFDVELSEFKGGLLFFYFSTLDQAAHMFWRANDPSSAIADQSGNPPQTNPLRDFYAQMDLVLGKALANVDSHTTLLVLSDHGFAPYYRSFNLNEWLLERGYLAIRLDAGSDAQFPSNIDWQKTKLYGLGLNGLYINLRGRESHGTVLPGREAENLLDEVTAALLAQRDGVSTPVITRIDRASTIYKGKYADRAPDLIVGYNRGYRAGWSTVLGGTNGAILEDNNKPWSGDHCIDPNLVPGVILANRPLPADSPGMIDIAPTILAEFGIPKTANMQGRPLFPTVERSR